MSTMRAEEDAARNDCGDDGESIVGESNEETMVDTCTEVVITASNLYEQWFGVSRCFWQRVFSGE